MSTQECKVSLQIDLEIKKFGKIYILIFFYCSAWSKSKSKEQNFGFGPKQNTKITFKPPPPTTHHHPPKTFKGVPGKLEA